MDGLESDQALLKDLIKWAKKPPSQIAKAAGLAVTTITRPFGGTATTRLTQPTFDKLKAAFPNFPGWRREFPDQVGMMGQFVDPNEKPGDLAYVRSADISLAMGDGAFLEEFPSTDLVPFNMHFLRAITHATTDELLIITSHGDSMEPTLLRSDMLMVDTSRRSLSLSDHVWAFEYAGGGMIKRLRRVRQDGESKVLIISDNPSVPVQMAELNEINLIGQLIWVGRWM